METQKSIDFLKTFLALAETLYKINHRSMLLESGSTYCIFSSILTTSICLPLCCSRTEVRPFDGFVYAISPFNFTALAVNPVLAPVIVGNVVIWKPSPGAVYSSWLFNTIMIEAGLPAGVVQFLPGDAETITQQVFKSRDMGGLHFTGSTAVFKTLLSSIGERMKLLEIYPRVVGRPVSRTWNDVNLIVIQVLTPVARRQKIPSHPSNSRFEKCCSQDNSCSVRISEPKMQCLFQSLRPVVSRQGIQGASCPRNQNTDNGVIPYGFHRPGH